MHPNGIRYNITKEKLPFLNQEIAKILATIVDFEIFFENDDSKLNILIKHPGFESRSISMGSGAEKTIAAMAIRLALINITNLPKPNMFILDEPGTALDEENMEGFIRLLNISKSYFKTVLIISHLDSLKDIADTIIDIQRKGSYAYVNQ
jgi:DNA repair exonuclease SbcCD ATPase subunit